jgi:hypothetical protein
MGRDQGPISPDRARSEDQSRGNPLISQLAVLIFSACVLLVGCTEPIYSYSKAGSDVSDFRQDSYACVQEPQISRGASETPMTVGASTDGKREALLYRMCMRARGWTAEAPQ